MSPTTFLLFGGRLPLRGPWLCAPASRRGCLFRSARKFPLHLQCSVCWPRQGSAICHPAILHMPDGRFWLSGGTSPVTSIRPAAKLDRFPPSCGGWIWDGRDGSSSRSNRRCDRGGCKKIYLVAAHIPVRQPAPSERSLALRTRLATGLPFRRVGPRRQPL
jgi:hypothetical protein